MATTWHKRYQVARAARIDAEAAHEKAFEKLMAKADAFYAGHGPRLTAEDRQEFVASGQRLSAAEVELFDNVMNE